MPCAQRDVDLAAHRVEIAGQAGHIARAADAAGDGGDALGERRVGLVRQAVVVLDEVDAAAGELLRQLRQPRRRHALRLQRRAGERTAERADAAAQAVDAVARAAERRGEIGRNVHVQQHDVRVQRGVAEHHVEELPGIAADGGGGEADADVEDVAAAVLDRFDLAHDVAQDLRLRRWRRRGISTLCSTAIAWARASIEAASDRMR